ncbi:hypothetical protein ABK040_005762 [Willaertia magna]
MLSTSTPTPSAPQMKVELFISCQNLKNKDVLSKSDPCCVLYLNGKESGRTEVVKDNLNPSFNKTFVLDYKFEEIQPLTFRVYDIDNGTSSLNDDDFLGQLDVKLAEIVSASNFSRPLKDRYGKPMGHSTLNIRVEERSGRQDVIHLGFRGENLPRKDFLGKSDPYYIIQKQVNNNQWVDVVKSEVIMNDLNPSWGAGQVNVQRLCNGDYSLPLRILVFDWDKHSSHDFIGLIIVNLQQLKEAYERRTPLVLIDDGSYENKKKKAKEAGKLYLHTFKVEEVFSFIDYLLGGLEISLMVSIDFTASNGNPNDVNSLHFGGKMNEYEMAIRAVGDVLAYYDSDGLFPSFGFGAKINGAVSHCFALNGNPSNPQCSGVNGILQSYRQALNNVQLYGPTNFQPVLETAVKLSQNAEMENSQQNQKYFILLIITDGVITDMAETVREIVKASHYPLSIVIVGVGSAEFSSMEFLDSDDQKLRSGNDYAARDIVQFVPFRKFNSLNYQTLANETLAEIPNQIIEYFKSKSIKPNPKKM